MMVLSGELFHPYEFAKHNYARYRPARFRITPGYALLLALVVYGFWHVLCGSQIFIACVGSHGCLFYAILRGRVLRHGCGGRLLLL